MPAHRSPKERKSDGKKLREAVSSFRLCRGIRRPTSYVLEGS